MWGCLSDDLSRTRAALTESGMAVIDVTRVERDDGGVELHYAGVRAARFCTGVSQLEVRSSGCREWSSSIPGEVCVPVGDPRERAWRCERFGDAGACASLSHR
ncbi:MAG: hypothetical protein ABMA64_23095 [Myxococcota bacterium]